MVDLQMRNVAERLMEYGIQVHLTEPARHWIAQTGYDPQFGARPLRRTIQRFVENPLSVRLLRDDFHTGDLIVIDELNGKLIFERHEDTISDYLRPAQQAESPAFREHDQEERAAEEGANDFLGEVRYDLGDFEQEVREDPDE